MSVGGDSNVPDDPETLERLRRIEEAINNLSPDTLGSVGTQETIDATVQDNEVLLDTGGRETFSLSIESGGGATYSVDARNKGQDWEDRQYVIDDVTRTTRTFITGERYIRVRVTDPADSPTDAKITLSASGG